MSAGDHFFERYFAENGLQQTLGTVGRPQSTEMSECIFQTFAKYRWRFDSLQVFVGYCNHLRPHQSLKYDELGTSREEFDK